MAEYKSYYELLRDPRWQRRRLEIMQRDDFECTDCGDKENPLNVHHVRYKRGRKPWEYDDCDLETLCEDCHAEQTRQTGRLNDLLDPSWTPWAIGYLSGKLLTANEVEKVTLESLQEVLGFLEGSDLEPSDFSTISTLLHLENNVLRRDAYAEILHEVARFKQGVAG